MLMNRVYYLLKPIVPWPWRIALRRWWANRRRQAFADVWPIDVRAGGTPAGWLGWPEGKRFALVLTHDVEGTKGLSRVEQLMNIEVEQGLRSCFNLVPEGEYRVPDAMRNMLDQAGFEVGIHGLEHDGKLYSSRTKFATKVLRINRYLEKWKCSGFRSPFMQHKLEWLHKLHIEYDSSTFDTDPFEPQSDGAGTIFPFWVSGPNASGYVELPYTLPQDFTLFKVLEEKGIDIWKRKVDWIAERGGMILLNVHPDYMCFKGQPGRDEYPVSHYQELLRYIHEKYDGSYWPALPREVVRYYRGRVPLPVRNTRKKICMVAYTTYEGDNHVRQCAETLAKRGDRVDVVAVSTAHLRQQPESELNGVKIYRVQHRKHKESSQWISVWRLVCFLINSSRAVTRLHKRNRYDVIHVHNLPDFLVFAAWYPKMTGTKLILDIRYALPELFASKSQTKLNAVNFSLLLRIERISAKFVDHVLISNLLWYKTGTKYLVPEERCSVLINHVDPEKKSRRPRTRTDSRFVVLYPDSLRWQQELDITVSAFAEVKRQVPNAEFHIYTGSDGADKKASLRFLLQKLDLEECVKLHEDVALDEVVEAIANAGIGVAPKRADSVGNKTFSTQIMEFISQGVPVIVSRANIDSFYFEQGMAHFFPSGDSQAMAEAMLDVINNKELRESFVPQDDEYCDNSDWHWDKKEYMALIDSLSTEYFDGIDPTSSVSSKYMRNSKGRAVESVIRDQVGRVTDKLDGPASASTLKKS